MGENQGGAFGEELDLARWVGVIPILLLLLLLVGEPAQLTGFLPADRLLHGGGKRHLIRVVDRHAHPRDRLDESPLESH